MQPFFNCHKSRYFAVTRADAEINIVSRNRGVILASFGKCDKHMGLHETRKLDR